MKLDSSSQKTHPINTHTAKINRLTTLHTLTKMSLGIATISVLAACSGAKDNLGVGNSSANNACTGECVNIEFTNEPLEGVNYTCGNVNYVTGKKSQAQCPNNTELKFFIRSKNGQRKIALGNTQVTALNANSVGSFLLRRTPLDLVTTKEITSSEDEAANTAANIIRFLDALRVKKEGNKYVHIPYNPHAPVNITHIKDDIKANMDEYLTEDITLKDFSTDAFITKTKTWLDSHGLAITMSSTEAKKQLKRVLNTNFSSVYYQPSLAISPLNSDVDSGLNNFLRGLGIYGNTLVNNDVVNMTIYGLTMRDGGHIGQGLYWSAPTKNDTSYGEQQYQVFYSVPFKKMRKLNPEDTSFNLYNQKISQFKWQMLEKTSTGDEKNGDIIDFTQGQFLRNFVMIGNQSLKESYIGSGTVADDVLGKWQQISSDNSINSTVAKGSATITKIPRSAASTLFDPEVWRSKHVVETGKGYIFPMHAVLEFRYGLNSEKCGSTGCDFSTGNKVGITILESGDIITDGSNTVDADYPLGKPDCSISDYRNGVYQANGYNEKRIGTVRATSQRIGDRIGSFINPGIMFSGADFKELDGVQIGTRAVLDSPITIDIATMVDAANANTGDKGTPGMFSIISSATSDSAGNKTTTYSLKSAMWANIYNSYESIRLNSDDKTDSEEDKEVIRKVNGTVNISLPDCYTIKTRN